MARKIIVVTAAYGNDHVKALGGQHALLPTIAAAGADGVEIRRELLGPQVMDELSRLSTDIERKGLEAYYSAPEGLFEPDGSLNPRLHTLLHEARRLNAVWIKLSLGHFTHSSALDPLRGILADSEVALVVENDQTPCGKLAPMQRFQAAVRVQNLPVSLTFDMGNWLWVDESPEEAARMLAPAVGYVHVKGVSASHHHWRAVPPDEDPRWLALLNQLPCNVPRGIEFPLQGRDLTAVTRHYVNLLREE